VNTSRAIPRSYGTAGAGTVGHLAVEFVAQKAGIKLVHVPYNGPMLGDVISGVLDVGSMGLSTAAANIAGGKLRGFGVSTNERLPDYPDIATMREQGFDLVAANWLALSGPAGLPSLLVSRLNREVIKVLDLPEVRQTLRQEIIEPIGMRPDELTRFVQNEITRWTPIVQSTGLIKQ
jgi:tripartite-type tricarboxylate transporter receptor subunit TctC